MMNAHSFIQASGLTHQYPRMREPALQQVDLDIPQGCSFGLLGPNGAGKTTLLSILTGLIPIQTGKAAVAGYDLATQVSRVKQQIALVPQDLAFYANLSGTENLQFFADIAGLKQAEFKQQLEYCTQVCQLQEMLNRRAGEYSGGMKRRLNLAIGLLNSPKILFLDEPTVGIDALSRQIIISAIQSLRTQGTTIIYTSHYMEEVEAICDELAIINRGRVVARNRTEQLRQQGSEKTLTLTFASLPDAVLIEELQQWRATRIHEREFALILNDVRQLNLVLDTCHQHHMMIDQLQFGMSRLEQTYLSLLKDNASSDSESLS
jgi:ABC-2 type transport system ATP-binding protein